MVHLNEYIRRAEEAVYGPISSVLQRAPELTIGKLEGTHRVKFYGSKDVEVPVLHNWIETLLEVGSPISWYGHMPICRHRCTFCHYPVVADKTAGKVAGFVRDLGREQELFVERFPAVTRAPVSSCYFGGGTPTEMSPSELGYLVGLLSSLYSIDASTERSIEGTPETFTDEKVACLKELGFNRVSIGIQTLDDDLLRLMNRRHTGAQALDALDRIVAADIPQVNADFIYGFPGQTAVQFLQDLQEAVRHQPSVITAYRLRGGRKDEIASHVRRLGSVAAFPGQLETYVFQVATRLFLSEHGYEEGPAGWYSQTKNSNKVYNDRWIRQRNLFGFGWHTYSYGGSFQYTNQTTVGRYRADLAAGRLPIKQGQIYSLDEQFRRYIFFRLKACYEVNFKEFADRFSCSLLQLPEWVSWFAYLEELGLAVRTDNGFVLTNLGQILMEEIIEKL